MSLIRTSFKCALGRGINFLNDFLKRFSYSTQSSNLSQSYCNFCKEFCKRTAGDSFVSGRSFQFEGMDHLTGKIVLSRIHRTITLFSYSYELLRCNNELSVTSIEYDSAWYLSVYSEAGCETVYDIIKQCSVTDDRVRVLGTESEDMCNIRGYLLTKALEILLAPIHDLQEKNYQELITRFFAIMSYDSLLRDSYYRNLHNIEECNVIQCRRENAIRDMMLNPTFENSFYYLILKTKLSDGSEKKYIKIALKGKKFLSTVIEENLLSELLGPQNYDRLITVHAPKTYDKKYVIHFSAQYFFLALQEYNKVNRI